ncbi:MAG: hypothetical protein KAT47_00975 [Candidatus Aegiribacteria sp.]|nr:hypothetical protein [Candidatus Aegiribacteria sp.]
MKHKIAIAILGSLVLLSACGDQLPTDIPDPYGYQGFLDRGWAKYEDEIFSNEQGTGALDYFKDAIDCNVQGIEGFVGAGWSALFVSDEWRIADNYFYMAIQLDAGAFPMMNPAESQVQDTTWTVFECIDPVLPDSVLEVIAALGETWYDWPEPGDTTLIDKVAIGAYLHGSNPFQNYGPDYGDRDFSYRFQPLASDPMAMFTAANGFSASISVVDSIIGGWIYITTPLAVMDIGGDNYYVWINADDQMNYEYRTFTATGSETQYTYDALAGIVMLQDIRGENGDPLLGAAAAWGLDQLNSDYSFGSGRDYAGLETISNVQLKGTAAAIAYANQAFMYAWFTCTSEGYGDYLDPDDPGFVVQLMAVIEEMLNS